MKESELPYSFIYKMRQAFWGKECPVCNREMRQIEYYSRSCVPSIQHNIPITKGGKHELSNISIICNGCNISIRDTITGELNNKEVTEIWNLINNLKKPKALQ